MKTKAMYGKQMAKETPLGKEVTTMTKEQEQEYRRLINEANIAKYKLFELSERLGMMGYYEDDRACKNLAFAIEEWQSKH